MTAPLEDASVTTLPNMTAPELRAEIAALTAWINANYLAPGSRAKVSRRTRATNLLRALDRAR